MQKSTLLLIALGCTVLLLGSYQLTRLRQGHPNDSHISRLILWAKMYLPVQKEDINHIEHATSMREFFVDLKKVPTCRSAKLLAHLYFSIYVERDSTLLHEFIELMKEFYPSRYQWTNAFQWKQADYLLRSSMEKMNADDETTTSKSDSKKSSLKSK
jgi:hypothetical protein